MARPRKDLNVVHIEKLASYHLTTEEIASFMECSPDTLERRYAGILEKGKNQGKISLKRKQMEVAMSGNVTMLIWLGKQYLGQREKSPEELENEREARIQAYYISEKDREVMRQKTTQELQEMFQSRLEAKVKNGK